MNRVLMVDDEPSLLDVAKEYLETIADFQIDTTMGAPDALGRMRTMGYDAIISDYQMPFMDGIEFLKALRGSGDRTPFILFTGKGREEIAIEALNSGADFYVNKGGEPRAQFVELSNMVTQAIARRKAEVALANSEHYFKALIENSSDVIAVIGFDGIIHYVSPSIRQVMGYEPERVQGLSILRFAPPVMDETAAKGMLAKLARRESPSIEIQINDGTGRERDLEVIGNLYHEDDVPRVIVHVRDITERKRSEMALRMSEERFRCTFDQSPMGAAMVGMDLRFIQVNEALSRILGYSETELRELTFKEITHPEDVGTDMAGIQRLARGEIDQYTTEKRYVRKDGATVNARVTVRVIKDAKGVPIHFLPLVEDVTKSKQAADELAESEQRYHHLFNQISNGVAIYQARAGGEEFLIKDLNPAGQRLSHVRIEEIRGRSVAEVFPGVKDMGLFEVLQRVWRTGEPEHLPMTIYKDDRMSEWVENYVFKLPSGDVVAVYNDVTDYKRALDALQERTH